MASSTSLRACRASLVSRLAESKREPSRVTFAALEPGSQRKRRSAIIFAPREVAQATKLFRRERDSRPAAITEIEPHPPAGFRKSAHVPVGKAEVSELVIRGNQVLHRLIAYEAGRNIRGLRAQHPKAVCTGDKDDSILRPSDECPVV
jgi:hypothetical protein